METVMRETNHLGSLLQSGPKRGFTCSAAQGCRPSSPCVPTTISILLAFQGPMEAAPTRTLVTSSTGGKPLPTDT